MCADTQESTRVKLFRVLEKLALDSPRVRAFDAPGSAYSVMAQVVSPDYELMDEADRQAMVWRLIHKELTTDEQRRVEFVYTDAPSELEDGGHEQQATPSVEERK